MAVAEHCRFLWNLSVVLLNIDKDMISITKKIFPNPQICDWSFPSLRNFSFSKACLIYQKWKPLLNS